jgi:hypothetical protein
MLFLVSGILATAVEMKGRLFQENSIRTRALGLSQRFPGRAAGMGFRQHALHEFREGQSVGQSPVSQRVQNLTGEGTPGPNHSLLSELGDFA